MTAIVYTRVSTEEQARHGYSLEAQEETCRARALSLGAAKVLVFSDEGVSGELLERPGLQKALEAAKGKDVKLFVCLDPDRLSRKLAHQLVITDEIEKAGVRLEFVNFEWKDTPEGRLFYSLRGAIAEYEKEKIKTRSRMGRLAKAKRGEKTHHLPIYGYREEPGRLVIDEEKSRIVRQMFEWAAAGDGPYVIANRLTEMGVPGPTGGRWYRGVIARMLKNPAYMGTVYLNRYDCSGLAVNKYRPPGEKLKKQLRPKEEWIPVNIPAIVEPALWERAQLARGRRRKLINGSFLLSGLVRCGTCGLPMWGTSYKNKNGKRYRYYLCAAKKDTMDMKKLPDCDSRYVPAGDVESTVWGAVVNWLSNPEGLLGEMQSTERKGAVEKEIEDAARRLNEIEKERRRAFTAFTRGWVDEKLYKETVSDIEAKHEKLSLRVANLYKELAKLQGAENSLEGLKELAQQYIGRINELEFEEKSRLVHLLVEKVTVFSNRVEIVGRVPEEICRYSDTPIVVGDPVEAPDGSVIIPISRVACGFAAGGGEFEVCSENKEGEDETQMPAFGGGSGAGVSVRPIGFLVAGNGQVRLLPVDGNAVIDRLLDLVPQIFNQIQSMLTRGGGKQPQTAAQAAPQTPVTT